jgi:glycosyltransferase involved in cell wall biosynthesis
MRPVKLSVLVPAHDEMQTIGETLRRVIEVDLAALGVEKEIIVCDDGSSDSTAELADALAAVHPCLTVLRLSVLLLYALEGALLGLRWDRLPEEVKRNLRERAGIATLRPKSRRKPPVRMRRKR